MATRKPAVKETKFAIVNWADGEIKSPVTKSAIDKLMTELSDSDVRNNNIEIINLSTGIVYEIKMNYVLKPQK